MRQAFDLSFTGLLLSEFVRVLIRKSGAKPNDRARYSRRRARSSANAPYLSAGNGRVVVELER
jgi:hypothetical protein